MAQIFSDILAKGARAGQMPARTDAARQWYRDQAKSVAKSGSKTGASGKNMIRELKSEATDKVRLGNMYLFQYDAKHKDKLPYWDRYPLIFPINIAKGGFLGINMHYLPPMLRAELMDELYKVTTNNSYDDSTRIRISYEILSGASKFRAFKPCIKHYLNSQLRSRFIYISPAEWDIALFLPMAQFVGATKQKVYADSRKIIRG